MKKSKKATGQRIETRMRMRVNHDAGVEVLLEEKTVLTGCLRDISQQGLYLTSDVVQYHALLQEQQYFIKLSLQHAQSSLVIEANGHVVRIDSEGCAIRFTHPLVWWPVFSVFPARKKKKQKEDFCSRIHSQNVSTSKHWVQDLSCL